MLTEYVREEFEGKFLMNVECCFDAIVWVLYIALTTLARMNAEGDPRADA